MAEGADAVKAALVREFGAIAILEAYDLNTEDLLLDFEACGLGFRVWVSREYDDDFATGQIEVGLKELGALLRASKNGRARVTRAGIAAQ